MAFGTTNATRGTDHGGAVTQRRLPHPFILGAAAHVGLALGFVALLATAPHPSGQVALVFAPGTSFAEAIRRTVASGARPIRPGRVDWIVLALPEAAQMERPEPFGGRARRLGVLAILNPMVAGGCATDRPT